MTAKEQHPTIPRLMEQYSPADGPPLALPQLYRAIKEVPPKDLLDASQRFTASLPDGDLVWGDFYARMQVDAAKMQAERTLDTDDVDAINGDAAVQDAQQRLRAVRFNEHIRLTVDQLSARKRIVNALASAALAFISVGGATATYITNNEMNEKVESVSARDSDSDYLKIGLISGIAGILGATAAAATSVARGSTRKWHISHEIVKKCAARRDEQQGL